MVVLELKLDDKSLQDLKKLVSPGKYGKAVQRATTRAISAAYTEANRQISKTYHIKVGDVKKLSELKKYYGYIRYGAGKKGRMLTTTHFKVSPEWQNQAGIPVKRRKLFRLTIKNKTITHWFTGPGKVKMRKMLWQRTGPGPKSVQPVKAISIAQMANKEILIPVQSKFQAMYEKNLQHEIDRIITAAGGV